MGRKSKHAFTALQATEAQKLLALQAIPPAPGEVRRRLPTIRQDMPTYAQPEFMAWFYASDQSKADGSWAVGLDAAGQGGPALAAEHAGQVTAQTYANTVTPPFSLGSDVAGDPVAGPDYWSAPEGMAEGRTVTRYGDEGPAGELLTEEAAAESAEAGSSSLLMWLALGAAVYVGWRVFRG